MLNRSNLPITQENKEFPDGFRASCQCYTQHYQAHNYLHFHDTLEIGRCIDGSGVQFIAGEVYSFTANMVSIVQRACIHDAHIIMVDPNEKPSEWQYIFADLDALGIAYPSERSFLLADHDLAFLFDLMFRELTQKQPGWQEQFRTLLSAFLHIGQRVGPRHNPMQHGDMADQVAAILHTIALDYASDLTVAGLANRANMSVSYFRKVFTANVGMSPQQYIIHVRLSMAEHLLRTTRMPILDISEEVGFHSLSSFNRLFLHAYGFSPRTLRHEG